MTYKRNCSNDDMFESMIFIRFYVVIRILVRVVCACVCVCVCVRVHTSVRVYRLLASLQLL